MRDSGFTEPKHHMAFRPSVFIRNEAYFLKLERDEGLASVYGPMPSLESCGLVLQEIIEHTQESLEDAVESIKKAQEKWHE